jgi:putative membrane protein
VTTSTRPRRPLQAVANAVRGFLIGMAELVPGVSGGTVALVTGVYDALIDSASHVLGAVRCAVTGPDRRKGATAELARTNWLVIAPVLLGMATAVLTMAGVMSGFVEDHPEHARGLFLGLVAASVLVPLSMLPPRLSHARRQRLRDGAALVGAALLAFWLIGLAGDRAVGSPAYWTVFLAAAVAVCALVVPGVSGSFFLLAVGLYQPTLEAVHERDLTYMAVFAAGAVVGLASFVQLLHYLLRHRRRVTLLVMAGLMVGSLRALWPWQGDGTRIEGEIKGPGDLVLPYDPWVGPTLLALAGAVLVLALIGVERRVWARRPSTVEQPRG